MITKITRPSARGILPRKRLFRLLDARRKYPVTWISGPAGSGKTALVSSYLNANKLPCLWYQVDEGDSDIASFFFYLGLAAKKVFPRIRKSLPLFTPEYLLGIPTFTLRFFENLYKRLKTPFCIIFDNYHRVITDSPLHEVILNGVSILPDGVKIILISRSDPPPIFARLHARDQMRFLEWNELRFTLEESRGVIRSRTPEIRSKKAIERLHEITDGWVAGLILISDAVKRGIELQSLEKSTPEEIVHYFGSELFSKMDKDTQMFLVKTAFLPRITVQMAEELTGLTSGGTILSALTRDNYFIEKHHSGEPVYQYHPLFRSFLLLRAQELLSQESILDLNHRAGILLEDSGQIEDAAEIFMGQKNWEGLTRLIMKHAPSMLAQGRYQLVEEWLSSLPKDWVENNAWLLFWLGSCRFPIDPSQSQRFFERAYKKFLEEGDISGTFLSWSSIIDNIAYSHKDFTMLDSWILVLEALMRDFKEFPSLEIGARVATSMFLALALRQPQHPEIEIWAERALSLSEALQSIPLQVHALFNIVFDGISKGEFKKAGMAIEKLQRLDQSNEVSPFFRVMTRLAEAMYYQITGHHEKCMKAVSGGLDLSDTTGVHLMDVPILAHAISDAMNRNDLETARMLLGQMNSSTNRFKALETFFNVRDRNIYHYVSAREALIRGDLEQASLHGELALKFCYDGGPPMIIGSTHLLKALILYQLQRNDQAIEHLSNGLSIAIEIKSRHLEFNALLIKAFWAMDQGDESSCLILLREALTIGKNEKLLATHMDIPSVTTSLCVKALEAGIEVEYVQEIIRRRGLVSEKPIFHLENWPWPLKIYTLGSFAIYKDTNPLSLSRKAQQKPLDMLRVLIALGGRGVREGEIADNLWPEADGDAAHMSITSALHRLRELLGREDSILLREGRLTLNEKICWVDAWVFEKLLEEAELRWREDIAECAVQLTEKAIRLYRGPFLGHEIEQPWSMFMSERLRSKFLRSVGKLGDYWSQTEQWEKARECYEKGMEVDDLAEEFCQGLMSCYQHLGLKAEALSLYQRFEKRLKALLSVEPSPKTKALRDSLLATNQAKA